MLRGEWRDWCLPSGHLGEVEAVPPILLNWWGQLHRSWEESQMRSLHGEKNTFPFVAHALFNPIIPGWPRDWIQMVLETWGWGRQKSDEPSLCSGTQLLHPTPKSPSSLHTPPWPCLIIDIKMACAPQAPTAAISFSPSDLCLILSCSSIFVHFFVLIELTVLPCRRRTMIALFPLHNLSLRRRTQMFR